MFASMARYFFNLIVHYLMHLFLLYLVITKASFYIFALGTKNLTLDLFIYIRFNSTTDR